LPTCPRAARTAAAAGLEVFVLDAGWYLGNPLENPANAFSRGLGTWVEDPARWRARPGQGGSPQAGLRNFSDYVHSLEVRRPNGTAAGKLRFGLWIEPERFDPHLAHPARVPASWALPGAPILDFARPEVVEGMTARIQQMVAAYRVDYLKVDANLGVGPEPALGRSGHFWTRWSAGFEQLLSNLRQANPGLFLEHCASGLKRYWIGMPRLVHGSWLDDDVKAETVGRLLDAADALLLPRQKVVLIKDLPDQTALGTVIAAYWGAKHRNGGVIGFSGRLDRWDTDQQHEASRLLQTWKQDVRGDR
jgi:alpha-galactosidase